jgi:hypothetical protein
MVLVMSVNAAGRLQADVTRLKDNDLQLWQFLFGQRPNCARIEPTSSSWCGGVTSGLKAIKNTLFFVLALLFVSGGITNADKISQVLKWIIK